MDEGEFWTTKLRGVLVRECQRAKLRFHFHRIENAIGAGTPDVSYCIGGVDGWLELKWGDRYPQSLDAKVLHLGKGLRRSQITWNCARAHAGAIIFVGVACPDHFWLINISGYRAEDMDDIQHWSVATLNRNACWYSGHDIYPTLPLTLMGESPTRGGISGVKQE